MLFAKAAQFTCIALAAAGVYGFVSAAREGETRRACTPLCALHPDYAARNRLAPDFELPKVGGGTVKLSSYRGKIVILNFWTKTCRPCLEEMPSIAGLAKALAPHPDMVLLTISTDDNVEDARDTLKSVLGGSEPPFVVMVDSESKVVADKFGTKLFPETWFIDRSGVIRGRVDGGRDWNAALTIDLARSFDDPIQCGVEFHERRAQGPFAGICGEIATSGE
ncbi:MAG TPA: TlpA disulfide reductase family protein [Polyangiaceae bacterium]|nr:TlpA disulfide reductase family protein [Polyangiaceae bacterium]